MQKTAGYDETIVNPTPNPTDVASAEIALTKSRQETYGGLLREVQDLLKAERLYSSSLVQQLADERAANHKLGELLHLEQTRRAEMLQQQITQRREDARESMRIADEALAQAYAGIERAKLTATVLNTPPEPKTTAGENLADVGKHLISEASKVLTLVFAGDPAAQERMKRLLSMGEAAAAGAPGAAPAAAAPAPEAPAGTEAPGAAPAAAAPSPQAPAAAAAPAQTARKVPTALELCTIAQTIASVDPDRMQAYCASKGISVEELSIEAALALARETAAAGAKNGS